MRVLDGPMDIELTASELRMLCEAALTDVKKLTALQKRLINNICYHMIWDDLEIK